MLGDRLAAAPWLLLAFVAVGPASGLDALKAVGVIAALIGGGLGVASGVRAATRPAEQQAMKPTSDTSGDSSTSG